MMLVRNTRLPAIAVPDQTGWRAVLRSRQALDVDIVGIGTSLACYLGMP
jgi:hypothetical protein